MQKRLLRFSDSGDRVGQVETSRFVIEQDGLDDFAQVAAGLLILQRNAVHISGARIRGGEPLDQQT